MAHGIIYIMTSSIDGVIKIGKAERKEYKERMRKLEVDGYSTLAMHWYFASYVSNYHEKEKLIHEIFGKSQLGNSELFALDKDLAKRLIENFEGEQIYPVPEQPKPAPEPKPKEDDGDKNQHKKAKRFSFAMLDIPVNSELVFVDDTTKKWITKDDKHTVTYNGKPYSLSKLAEELKGRGPLQGTAYFTYNGKLLTDIRKEKEDGNAEIS